MGATAAQAQNLYGELAYQSIDADLNSNPAVLRATLGYDMSPNLAVEGMIGTSLTEGKETVSGIPVKLKISNLWGVYVKPKMKITDSFELFGRFGYAGMKATATASAFGQSASASEDGSDVSYGVGASYAISPQMSISADFMKYDDVDAFAIGFGFKF